MKYCLHHDQGECPWDNDAVRSQTMEAAFHQKLAGTDEPAMRVPF